MRWPILVTLCVAGAAAAQSRAKAPSAVELLAGERVGTMQLLALAPLGTPEADLAKKLPKYDRSLSGSPLRDAAVFPELVGGKLVGFWINGLDHKETPPALDRFRTAWGESVRIDNASGPLHIWTDSKSRVALYAQVVKTVDHKDHSNLFVRRYTPIAELVGDKPGEIAALRKRALLGATKQQLTDAYGAAALNGNALELGGTEWQLHFDIDLHFDDKERVERYTVRFTHGTNGAAIRQSEVLLRHLFGTMPAPDATVKLGRTRAKFYKHDDSWSLEVSAVGP